RLVGLCCELLLPESNCPADVRLAGLEALRCAMDEHLAFLDKQTNKLLAERERKMRRSSQRPQLQHQRRQGARQAVDGEGPLVVPSDADVIVEATDAGATGPFGERDGDGGSEAGSAGGGAAGEGADASCSDGCNNGHEAALLWSQASVDAILFSLLHDPSIKPEPSDPDRP
ncbi:hypothetical protein VaNZ11_002360, partial [Volvox africanus]